MKLTKKQRDYLEECYQGQAEDTKRPTRLFEWWWSDSGIQVRKRSGIMEDFLAHLEDKWGTAPSPGYVHHILRQRGHRLFHAPHPCNPDRPVRGKVKPKAPEAPRKAEGPTATPLAVCDAQRLFKEAADAFLRLAVVFENLTMQIQAQEGAKP